MWRASRLKVQVGVLTVSIFNVHTLASNGKNGLDMPTRYWKSAGRTAVILSTYRRQDRTAKRGSEQWGTSYIAVDPAEV